VHRNGERVPFTSLSVALRDIPGVRQYQVIQHSLDEFELRIVRDDSELSDPEFKTRVENKFRDHFGYLPEIRHTREEKIERGENGKFYASISRI